MALNNSDQKASSPRARYGEGLQLRPLNVEKGSDRFHSKDDIFPPQTAHWRCNLTALSQRRNLLFVACSTQIYVWEPAGASQTLGTNPEMIINPVMKEPRGEAYIQPACPHDINSILVDDLGREEVLLLVTDSGNVCGYRIEAIFSALKRAADSGKTKPLNTSEVDPFFIEYVGASAWGLAIHKFARLIAVSANTGLVTVFAFALVDSAAEREDDSLSLGEDEDFTDYGQTWQHIRTNDQFNQFRYLLSNKRRTRNIKLSYTGHFSNIPSVTFLNSDLDPNGTWMVSTDIDNKVIYWKVWEDLGPFNVYYLNYVSFGTFPDALHNDSDRGWTVIALDPRTFHLVKSTEDACGGQPQRRVKDGQAVLDLTKLSNDVPDASRLYNYFPPAVRAEPEETVLPDIFGADCLIGGSGSTQEKRGTRATRSSAVLKPNHPSVFADAFSHQAVYGSTNADDLSDDNTDATDHVSGDQQATGQGLFLALNEADGTNGTVPPGHGPLTTPQFLQYALLEALGGDVHEVEALLGESLGHDSDDDEDDHYFQNQHMDDAEDDPTDVDDMSGVGIGPFQVYDPPTKSNFPVLHFSQTDIRLIPHPFATTPSVVCDSPLLQSFAHPIVSIRHFDRFNMVKYIPEHGIVVAVSQKGRAAIIALTESRSSGYSFRVDWIVPLESQEKYGDRPLVPLLGMSVSPMQGFEIPPDVPYIPRDNDEEGEAETDINSLNFQYTDSNASVTHSSTSSSAPSNEQDQTSNTHGQRTQNPEQENLTTPEYHARATRAYQPAEIWRGWNPSRRYRLLLMYADHTVMSYEFWYSWNFSSSGAGAGPGGSNHGDVGEDEDDYLIL
ncbi:hypothetical protein BJX70DRAFT_397425 [Aspergillus crustosus]